MCMCIDADSPGMAEIISRADDVLEGRLYFTKIWDMERCETPYKVDFSKCTLEEWEVVPNGDPEWCFMLNRMDYLDDLCLAWLATRKERYAERAVSLMLSWVSAHAELCPGLSTRTLDTGVRLSAMARALHTLENTRSISPLQAKAIRESISEQIGFMHDHYLPKYETSNWGSIQTLSILAVYGRLSVNPENERWWQWAFDRAEAQLAAQVYPDGTDWELSTMYQVEVLIYALQAQLVLSEKGLPIPKGLVHACRGLAQTLAMQVMPDGTTEALGDSDRSNVRPLLALTSAILGDPELKWVANDSSLDPLDVYSYGIGIEASYKALAPRRPRSLTLDAYDSGLFVTRSSWNSDANVTVFLDGPLGSGHGHCDELHLSVWSNGRPILVDSGRYSYWEDSSDRPRLKGVSAHNVPTIDGHSSSEPLGSWEYEDFSYPLKPYVRHTDGLDYWEGAVVGHDPTSVLLRRVVCASGCAWVIIDQAWCDGVHDLQGSFHLDPSIRAQATEGGWLLGDTSLVLHAGEGSEIVQECCSMSYNQMSDQDVILTHTAFKGRGVQIATLAMQDVTVEEAPLLRADGSELDASLARCVRLVFPNGTTRTVAVTFGEVFRGVKAFLCDGVSFHAGVAVVTRGAEGSKLDVLRG